MDIVIDFSFLNQLLYLRPEVLVWRILAWFGWIPVAITLLWGFYEIWIQHRRAQWAAENANFMLLAIDIPRENIQSPKSVENMFSYIAGAHSSFNLIEKYWEGKWQLYFSFEIVSIEGYTQFLIYTPVDFRDLVESAVYSQYPDAEITEVDDYTAGFPTRFPDEKYDLWGTEFILAKNHMLPIKTYLDFEHQFGKESETHFRDPLATLMDLNSSLGPGEQLWHQIIVIPTGFDWPEEGDKAISKILGEPISASQGFLDKIFGPFLKIFDYLSDVFMELLGVIMETEKKEEDSFKMMNLKPKTKRQVEGIERKTSKLGFECKIRMVYLAEKEVMRKPKVANGFVGYMKQFGDLALNNIKPDTDKTATTVSYFLKQRRLNARKNRIMNNFVKRNDVGGRRPFILNIEELATLWHFPIEASVKAPLIQKTTGRKAEAPMDLPRSELGGRIPEKETPEFQEESPEFLKEEEEKEEGKEEGKEEKKDSSQSSGGGPAGAPPGNLPTI